MKRRIFLVVGFLLLVVFGLGVYSRVFYVKKVHSYSSEGKTISVKSMIPNTELLIQYPEVLFDSLKEIGVWKPDGYYPEAIAIGGKNPRTQLPTNAQLSGLRNMTVKDLEVFLYTTDDFKKNVPWYKDYKAEYDTMFAQGVTGYIITPSEDENRVRIDFYIAPPDAVGGMFDQNLTDLLFEKVIIQTHPNIDLRVFNTQYQLSRYKESILNKTRGRPLLKIEKK